MELKKETASQLFARLSASAPNFHLHDILFSIVPDGLKLGDLIEICGEECSGKTEVLYSILAYCLLPQTIEQDRCEHNNNALAIYIDTDYKFSVLRLTKVLEGRVRSLMSCWTHAREGQSVSEEHVSEYVRRALSRLLVYKASSSDALSVVLQNLTEFLPHHKDICLLMVDSISAFYAKDRIFGVSRRQQETKQRRNVELISNLINNHSIIVIATKSLLFSGKKHHVGRGESRSMTYQGHNDFMSQEWQAKVKYRILIQRIMNDQTKMRPIDSATRTLYLIKPTNVTTRSVNFTLTEDGIAS